jgi:hypothetical protein
MDRTDPDLRRRRLLTGLVPAGIGLAAVLRDAKPAYAAAGDDADDIEALAVTGLSVTAFSPGAGSAGAGRDGVEGDVVSYAGQTRPGQTRLRVSHAEPDANGAQHLSIVPYGQDTDGRAMGMAIDYSGVIEAWCKDFSVHCNHQTGDPHDAARFWVGDEVDDGGLFVTANYGDGSAEQMHVDLAADRFTHASHGSMRFIVRDTRDQWRFARGPFGAENDVLTIDAINGNLSVGRGRSWNVNVGGWGPENQSGIAFGISGDVRLYRSGPRTLRTDGTLDIAGAFAAGPGSIRIGDGAHVSLGGTNGSSWGTAPEQKQAWWGAAPVTRPTGTPAAATDLESALHLLNDLRATLIRLGLIS